MRYTGTGIVQHYMFNIIYLAHRSANEIWMTFMPFLWKPVIVFVVLGKYCVTIGFTAMRNRTKLTDPGKDVLRLMPGDTDSF